MKDITVILSGYKRGKYLREQYEAIKNQTHKNIDILLWINLIDEIKEFDPDIVNNCCSIVSNTNYGVWGRFAIALNAKSKYINIIDDDTIPHKKWLENCLETISKQNGVLTTRGIIMDKENNHLYPMPQSYTAHGWCNPNKNILQVDMGCHSWFFDKQLLRGFWANMPDIIPMNYGEDMHLSFIAQKCFSLGTFIPPHPKNNIDLWGSDPERASKYGSDESAISWSNQANMGMNKYWNYIRQNSYKILSEENK
jgi:glycosyltransferase involved in cell wall biosynthesis